MGGILNIEVCLKRLDNAGDTSHLVHRILGTTNLDVPFLGMHPGVVVSGIGSLFRPGDSSPSPGPDSTDGQSSAFLPMPN